MGATLLTLLLLAGCDRMTNQPRVEADDPTSLPAVRPAGVVAYGAEPFERPPVDAALLARGQERYAVFCTSCHGATGAGDGMATQRGFPPSPSLASPATTNRSAENLVSVILAGQGVMQGYAGVIAPADAYAIVTYLRALQVMALPRAGEPR